MHVLRWYYCDAKNFHKYWPLYTIGAEKPPGWTRHCPAGQEIFFPGIFTKVWFGWVRQQIISKKYHPPILLRWPALYFLLKTIHILSVSSWRGLWWRSFTNNTGSTLTCLATLLNSILTWRKQPQKSRVDLEIATNQDLHKVLCTLWKIYWFARAA